MTVKEKIIEQLKTIYEPGVVTAGQVYKGFAYDGGWSATGWWFEKFNGEKLYLGKSKDEAFDMIEQIESGRQDD